MKVLTVVGARPQFIKASVVSLAFKSISGVREILLHTGQHYDENLSEVFFNELEIPKPDYHLGIGSGTHGSQTGRMLEGIEEVLLKEKPDWVLVYGDTNSTLAGALAAVKLHIRVAHVEAGLRSYNCRMPEEINRILTDQISDILFTPTETAVTNLQREGINNKKIHLVGDVMYDVAVYYGAKAESKSKILTQLNLKPKEYILATIHRAENTDNSVRLSNIFLGLEAVAQQIPVILPLHPRTLAALQRDGLLGKVSQQLHLIKPVGYLDMVMLEKNAKLIATDSGGVQKEAFFYQVPCVTLRDETEWVELLKSGWNRLAMMDETPIKTTILNALQTSPGEATLLYGDGKAAQKIVTILTREKS